MAAEAQVENPAATKRCRVCGEEINVVARQCIHCRNWQDWRGNIGLSTTSMSLLIALLSVVTTAVPTITNALKADSSVLSIAFQQADRERVSLLVTNLGNRPGSLGSATLLVGPKQAVSGETELAKVHLDPVLSPDGAGALVAPGPTRFVSFASSDALPKGVARQIWSAGLIGGLHCRIMLDFARFDGSRADVATETPCVDLMAFLRAHEAEAAAPDKADVREIVPPKPAHP